MKKLKFIKSRRIVRGMVIERLECGHIVKHRLKPREPYAYSRLCKICVFQDEWPDVPDTSDAGVGDPRTRTGNKEPLPAVARTDEDA
jgi:hypothetical protein